MMFLGESNLRKKAPEIYTALREQGWTIERTTAGHLRLTSPAGVVVFGPATASDWRSYRNLESQLKRRGLKVRKK